MNNETVLIILTIAGILLFPILTLGCVLIYYGHPLLGTLAIVVSIIRFFRHLFFE